MGSLTRTATIRRLYQRIADKAGAEIERSSYMVLKHLVVDGPARVPDLAHDHGVEPSTMSRHVSALEAGGLVEKSPDPEDRRVALVEVSGKGTQLVAWAEAERHRLFASVLLGWKSEDAARFVALIERFNSEITELLDRP